MTSTSPVAVRIAAFQNAYVGVFTALAAFVIALITAITSLEVFCRYFLDASLVWAEEASRSLLIWNCFLFAGIAFQRGEMIAVNMLTSLLRPRLGALVLIASYLVTTTFLAAMVYYGWIYAAQNWTQTVPGLEMLWHSLTGVDRVFPIFWVYLALPVGFAILALHMIASIVRLTMIALAPSPHTKPEG